jgi:hypothetical protein
MRCETRALDDIRALGGNDIEDEHRFAAAARLSEINLANYRVFAQPAVRAAVTPPVAEAMRHLYTPCASATKCSVRAIHGWPGSKVLWNSSAQTVVPWERTIPSSLSKSSYRGKSSMGSKAGDHIATAGGGDVPRCLRRSPMQAALGIEPDSSRSPRTAPKSLPSGAVLETRIAALKEKTTRGGPFGEPYSFAAVCRHGAWQSR